MLYPIRFFIGMLVAIALPSAAIAQSGVYNATPPTLSTGERTDLQVDANGNLRTTATATISGSPDVEGTVASDAVDSGNPVKIGCIGATSTNATATGDRSDCITATGLLATANTTYTYSNSPSDATTAVAQTGHPLNFGLGMPQATAPTFWNGSANTQARQAINGMNTTGAGIQAVGQMGQRDDTSPNACTENQFCHVRITAGGMQLASAASVVPYSAILGTPAVQLANSSGNVANAAATATLTGTATTTVYISGFTCTAGGATAAALVNPTVTGTLGGTLTYTVGAPAGAAVMGTVLVRTFDPPHPASAVNTPIVVSMPALGAGNARASCEATGFYM